MQTPYDGQIAVLHWSANAVIETTVAEIINMLKQHVPNVKAIWIKTSNGARWQGACDKDSPYAKNPALRINDAQDVKSWVDQFGAEGIEVHAWCVLNGTDVDVECGLVITACQVHGLKSMVLDIEVGTGYFRGGPQTAGQMAQRIRNDAPDGFHIGLCLDPRGNHPRDIYIDAWLPYIDSLHPMTYHQEFSMTPEGAVSMAYQMLTQYGRPIIPMLQTYNLAVPNDIARAANASFDTHHALGISLFRFGAMGAREFTVIKTIRPPVVEPDDSTQPGYTNGEVVEAFKTAAQVLGGDDYLTLLTSAGLSDIVEDTDSPYTGPAIEDLPGLSAIEKGAIYLVLTGEPLPEPEPEPDPETDPVIGKYTNQQVINAFYEAAKQIGKASEYWDWIVQAGLAHIVDDRKGLYNSTPIDELPDTSDEIKQKILLVLASGPLAHWLIDKMEWVSQWGTGADQIKVDCGHACVLMLLRHYGCADQTVTVDAVVDKGAANGVPKNETTYGELRTLGGLYGCDFDVSFMMENTPLALERLRKLISRDHKPAIVLVDCGRLQYPTASRCRGLHWVVVTGYGVDEYVVHDPVWRTGERNGLGGANVNLSAEVFEGALKTYPAVFKRS